MPDLYPYERLIVEAEQFGLEVQEITFESMFTGLYSDSVIAIEERASWTEKNCIMAEEIGHFLTSFGKIVRQSTIDDIKQERRAMIYAYNKIIPLSKLIEAYRYGCANRYEASEFLNVTEQFFRDAMRYYYEHYGTYVINGDYILCFNKDNVSIFLNDESIVC